MKVEYHPLTVSDLNTAVAYLNQKRTGLGDELRSEIFSVDQRIRGNPAQFPVVAHGVRRCLVPRFPYAVLYRMVGEDLLRVLVIRHHRRHPNLGLGRRLRRHGG